MTFLGVALFASYITCYSEHPVFDFKALYDSQQWFQLRQAVNKIDAPIFYKGAVASVFNRPVLAQKYLKKVIASAPNSEEAYRARDLLTSLYLRSGEYRAALFTCEQMLASRPNQDDSREMHNLLSAPPTPTKL